jgi:tetratricopeptide (TPR) repeat protein
MKSAPRKPNVIPLSMDATFFFERALRSLDRMRYEKALKYFRRATELEPDNPESHCNMAGILSEMGEFEQSNAILSKILTEIDPGMTECYFYMANNYANMEDFEAAETALAQYMEKDPHGQYIEEAEEMMDLLGLELNRPARGVPAGGNEEWFEHDRARSMLESGKFAEAAELLEAIVKKRPDLLAARNNLALSYFYMGEYERSLGQIRSVLRKDPGNLHARCNLAIFCRHFGYKAELASLVEGLKKLVPYHPEHVFKLAATLGMLDEHDAAYAHFRRLLREGEGAGDPGFCHYAAVAAVGSGRKAEAFRWWSRAAKLDGRGSVAAFWLDEWRRREEAGGEWECLPSYYYLMPFEEQLRIAEMAGESYAGIAERNPHVASSLVWTLAHGDADGKRKALAAAARLLAVKLPGEMAGMDRASAGSAEAAVAPPNRAIIRPIGGKAASGVTGNNEPSLRDVAMRASFPEVRAALERFAADPAERTDLRRLAGRVLGVLDAAVARNIGGQPRRKRSWQAVVETALANADHLDAIERQDLQTLWSQFLARTYPEVPKIAKAEGWAAALEYLTARMHGKPVTCRALSLRYGVSPQTISRHAKTIDEACGLREKMEQVHRMEEDSFPWRTAVDSASPSRHREE